MEEIQIVQVDTMDNQFDNQRKLVRDASVTSLRDNHIAMASAQRVFEQNCAACHGHDAKGQAALGDNGVEQVIGYLLARSKNEPIEEGEPVRLSILNAALPAMERMAPATCCSADPIWWTKYGSMEAMWNPSDSPSV